MRGATLIDPDGVQILNSLNGLSDSRVEVQRAVAV